jgi:hypothetical protein
MLEQRYKSHQLVSKSELLNRVEDEIKVHERHTLGG